MYGDDYTFADVRTKKRALMIYRILGVACVMMVLTSAFYVVVYRGATRTVSKVERGTVEFFLAHPDAARVSACIDRGEVLPSELKGTLVATDIRLPNAQEQKKIGLVLTATAKKALRVWGVPCVFASTLGIPLAGVYVLGQWYLGKIEVLPVPEKGTELMAWHSPVDSEAVTDEFPVCVRIRQDGLDIELCQDAAVCVYGGCSRQSPWCTRRESREHEELDFASDGATWSQ